MSKKEETTKAPHKQENKKHQDSNKKQQELLNKIKELEEEQLRIKADYINYRKRKDEEVSKMLKYSNEELITNLLPIIDNFERAIVQDDDNLDDELSKFLVGFKMIYCSLEELLKDAEVKEIDALNKPFDPTFHQAVLTEKTDKDPGVVVEVLQKGYMFKDRVIRPTMVKVSE